MVDALDIALRLLRRLGGKLGDAELSAWARGRLREMEGEDAGPFAGEEESLKDVLKRCAGSRAGHLVPHLPKG